MTAPMLDDAVEGQFPLPERGTLTIDPMSHISQADIISIPMQHLWGRPNSRVVRSAHLLTKEQASSFRDFWRNTLKRGSLPFRVSWLKGLILTDTAGLPEQSVSGGMDYAYGEGGVSAENKTGWENVCLLIDPPNFAVGAATNLLMEMAYVAVYQRTGAT